MTADRALELAEAELHAKRRAALRRPQRSASEIAEVEAVLAKLAEIREKHIHPFTGEFVSADEKEQNRSESLRWYQVLTRSCDPVYLRNRMKAMGQLNSLNDPKVRQEPTP